MGLVVKDLEENLMRRKFTLEQRKRMLERLESGATVTDLKREFGIKDPRTLQRQLRQAREEQTLQMARADIIKESLRDHLAEVRTLIENWRAAIKAPSPPSFDRYPLSAAEAVEQIRLFEGIREHLPFPELWRSYQAFKMKWNEEDHRSIIAEWARSKKVVGLLKLLSELRDLERRILDVLEETLLRRDEILYSCKLCPGGGGLAFR